MFVRISEIGPDKRVTMYADPENFKLGFEFHNDEKPDSFALSSESSDKTGKKRRSLKCTGRGIALKYPWIKSVTRLPIKDRRFKPKKEGNRWVIHICPAFEIKKARQSSDITSDLQGIYRYLRENGEIVYIGKGNIKKRLMSPERNDWDFDVVEYSIVKDPDQQVIWEDYWIQRFKEDHDD